MVQQLLQRRDRSWSQLPDDLTVPVSDSRRTWPTALWIWSAASVVDYLRVPAAARDMLYAEDGRTFLGDWSRVHSFAVLYRPYAGYQHLLPRLVGGFVTGVLPVHWWAIAMTVIDCVLVGGASALVYVFSRDVVGSQIARLGLAAITVLTPIAGIEAVGNIANLHWYLQYLMLWLLLARPRSRVGLALMTLLAVVLTLTEPQCALLLPLAWFVAIRRPGSRWVVFGWLIGLAGQAATYLIAPRGGGHGLPPFGSAVEGYLFNVVLSDGWASSHVERLIVTRVGWWSAVVLLLVLLSFAGYAFALGTLAVRAAVASALTASFASWFLSFYVNRNPVYYYSQMSAEQLGKAQLVRWGTAAAMLLIASVPLAAGVFLDHSPLDHSPLDRPRLDRSPHRRRLPLAAVGVMVAVMCLSLVSPDNQRGRGAVPWIAALATSANTCRAEPQLPTVEVPTFPSGWSVPVACRDLR